MAANDYYNNPYNHSARPYHEYSSPGVTPLSTGSQYDNHNYPDSQYPIPHTPSNAGSTARLHNDNDPYEDADAVPMKGRLPHRHSSATVAPMLPHEVEDPFVRDARPQKQHRFGRGGKSWLSKPVTWVVYVLSVAQIIVFIAEISRNAVLTRSPIAIHPSFNPMIGPSPYVLINMGARYQPCMHKMPIVQNASIPIGWPCPNATSTTGPDVNCTLSQLCGNGGVPNPVLGEPFDTAPAPNQWWRFIVPIFLHAGLIHIGFNMLLQLTLGRDIEKLIGSLRFAIVYFACGIFGFVLGGNFAGTGISSVGCSGSLFGILALTLLDLLYTWSERQSPIKDLLFIILDCLVAFVLGLLPGLDNFSHIGGFLMGLVLGVCLLRSPASFTRQNPRDPAVRYSGISQGLQGRQGEGVVGFAKNPLAFVQNRRAVWWTWWLVRALALIGVLIGFILLLKNFYVWRTGCSWCKYLSCLPVTVGGMNWCDIVDLSIKKEPAQRRALSQLFAGVTALITRSL